VDKILSLYLVTIFGPIKVNRLTSNHELPIIIYISYFLNTKSLKLNLNFPLKNEISNSWLLVKKMPDKRRILIIDDDEVIRETMTMLLEEEGYIVDTAENGKEAIAKTFTNTYNLALVDWRLPDFEGTKLIGQLKETVPKMAKIMLTGYPSMHNAVDAVNAQADAFFCKPADTMAILEKIKSLLKQQDEARELSEEKMVNYIETRVKELMPTKSIKPKH